MITYKHEAYIKEAILGALSQDVDFAVELIIADDNSPDDTAQIVSDIASRHPNGKWIKYTKHNKNKGMMPNFIWALNQCSGKYIALCEGDDYWTDPYKLKKQVDFLEGNDNYNIVWTKFNKIDKLGNIIEKDIPNFKKDLAEVTSENLLDNYRTWTLTSIFRRSVFDDVDFSKFKHLKDNSIYFLALKNSALGRVLDLNTANYRVHENGVWSGASGFQNMLATYYNFNEIKKKIISNKSLADFTKSTFNQIYKNLIGYESLKKNPISVYNKLFFLMIFQLTLFKKIIFFKWYLIKIYKTHK